MYHVSDDKPSDSKDKVMFRSKGRIETYRRAIAKRKEAQPDLSEADWYREACDLLAKRDLAGAP